MNITVGVAAHVDAGKTTLIEQILYETKTIKQLGRVDKKNSFLDYHDIEKKRGITVFAEEAHIQYKNSNIHIIDTPGHIDFSSELERSIAVLDCCIMIISAASGVTSHTKTIWNLLRKHNIPTIFFVNKLDIIGTDYKKVCDDIEKNLTKDFVLFEKPQYNDLELKNIIGYKNNKINEDIIEQIANYDDKILEKYINEESINDKEIKDCIINTVNSCTTFPIFCGASLKQIGVSELLDFVDEFIITNYNIADNFSGYVYKIRYDENMQKITYIKALSGKIKIKDILEHKDKDKEIEKVNQIRIYNGNSYTNVNELSAGEYGAIPNLKGTSIGECFGDCEVYENSLTPALRAKVIYGEKYNFNDILNIFQILTEEDPMLNVTWVKELSEIHVNIMGTIQLEILKDVVLERFSTDISFDKPEVIYKETIKGEITGMGHFEPYRHFAEVTVKLTPIERNTGITFSSSCHVDDLPLRWQNTIERIVPFACKRGVLTGSELTDVNVELVNGIHDVKHSSTGDFKEATFRAVRKCLINTENILLEPYYQYSITVPNEISGKIMTDITTMCGNFNSPISDENNTTITGLVPISSFMDYPAKILSLTKGAALLSYNFAGYDLCHNSKEVIEKINYNNNADKEYTSHSVYCGNGRSFSVE